MGSSLQVDPAGASVSSARPCSSSSRLIAIEREIGTRAVQATGVRMEPRVVRLTFDREIETTFAVAKPQTVGTPLMGRVEVEYEPAEVRIRGPKRRLEDLLRCGNGCVSTEPVAEQQHGQRTQRG